MRDSSFIEPIVKEATFEWTEGLGYPPIYASEIASNSPNSERQTCANIVLINRLRSALSTINEKIPSNAIEDAIKKVTHTATSSLFENNCRFHKFLSGEILAKEAEKLVEAVT